MKAYEKKDLIPEVENSIEQLWKTVKTGIAKREEHKKYADIVRRLSFFYELKVYSFDSLIVEIMVDNLKDAEPALALIEDEFKVSFDHSYDTATSYLTERDYTATGLGFRLDVKVRHDSKTCKSVVVGYETVPKYEIRCDEEEQSV